MCVRCMYIYLSVTDIGDANEYRVCVYINASVGLREVRVLRVKRRPSSI